MANQDNTELDKFNSAADEWWQSSSLVGPLHAMNPIRLDWIKQHIHLENKRVLDIGCGGGILSESLAQTGAKVTGIDLAENVIRVAQAHAMQTGLDIEYLCVSVETLAQSSQEQYDVITCMELLEHVPNVQSLIRACSNLLKPNGCIFFSTINRNIKSLCCAILGAEYIMQLLPKGTHTFDRFIKPSELSCIALEHNLSVNDIIGLQCDIHAKEFSLTQDVSVNYMLYCTKQI